MGRNKRQMFYNIVNTLLFILLFTCSTDSLILEDDTKIGALSEGKFYNLYFDTIL